MVAVCPIVSRIRLVVTSYLLTTALVVSGICWGLTCFMQDPPSDLASGLQDVFHRWDSQRYLAIASEGYKYEGLRVGESVAFFPLYPLLVKTTFLVTGLSLEASGLLIPHVCFVAALAVFVAYLLERFPKDTTVQRYAVLSLCLFPAGFFFRLLYSESLFLLLALLSMYLIQRRCSFLRISLVIGLATAARPVGVALLLPFLAYVWRKEQTTPRRIKSLISYVPICCWGLGAYMVFQNAQFGEPFAFVKTQQHWRLRPEVDFFQMAMAFAAWEPIWSVYVPDSYPYWGRLEPHTMPILSLAFWNPIVLVASAILIVIGYRRSWLSLEEILLASGLLLIPYFGRGFHFCMMSQARFSSVAFPVYITCGHLLQRSRPAVRWVVLAAAALYLLYFSARFAAGFPLT